MKGDNIMKKLEENIIAVGIIIMFLMETFNVVCRFLIPSLAGVPEEISIFAYIWVCFLCASFCTKKGANIIVDALTMHYPEKLKHILFALQYVLDGILSVLFIYGSVLFVIHTKAEGAAGVTGIPLWVIYLAPLFGFGLNLLRDVQMFLETINNNTEKTAIGEGEDK